MDDQRILLAEAIAETNNIIDSAQYHYAAIFWCDA